MRQILIVWVAFWSLQSSAKFQDDHPTLHRITSDCGTALIAVAFALVFRPWFTGEEKPSQFPPNATVAVVDPGAVELGLPTLSRVRSLVAGRIYMVFQEGIGGHFERAIATDDGVRLDGVPLVSGYQALGEALSLQGPAAQKHFQLDISNGSFRWISLEQRSSQYSNTGL